ncbi:MAG: hypothetical protein ABSG32_02230 [Terriglobia bacterium]|jgi:tetratricopeptide (TPR) repeat protein
MQKICWMFSLLAACLVPSSLALGAQTADPIRNLELVSNLQRQQWLITGQVKDLKGTPVSNARIVIQCASTGVLPSDRLVADVQGKYSYTAELEAQTNPTLTVTVSAEKEGFLPAHETADFTKQGETWPIDLVMRPQQEDTPLLAQGQLVATLVARYNAASPPDLKADSAQQNFARASGMLHDARTSAKAVALLSALVKKTPQCVECRTLLGLADLQAGGVSSAQEDFSQAALVKLSPSEEPRLANSLLALGVLAEWSGESPKALGLLMRALKLAPEDPLALQEVGRTLSNQKNWEAADEYLLKAEKAGAPPEIRLLRCRAALEEGDVQEADQEMRVYLAGREIKSFPLPARALYAQVENQLSLQSFSKAQSLVDEPLPQILKEWPELEGLEPAADQGQLAAILEKTGATVEAFFRDFQNATSHELIEESKLAKDGKVKKSLEQKFQYLLLTTPYQGGLSLEEYRTDSSGQRIRPTGSEDGFMLSAGFASASLLFHPAYQSGAKFRHLGRAHGNGTNYDVVAFAQVPAKAMMCERFSTPDARVLVLHQGLAWIDPHDSRIVRLRTDLLVPMPNVRLQRETTEISYALVRFKDVPTPLSLPAQVTVTVQWKGATFQNQHQYSDFKLFNTAVKEKHPTPPATPPTGPAR